MPIHEFSKDRLALSNPWKRVFGKDSLSYYVRSLFLIQRSTWSSDLSKYEWARYSKPTLQSTL